MPADLPPNPWFSVPRPSASAPLRYWCFPYAGGGAAVWQAWSAALAPATELVAIRLPGRENRLREPCVTRLTPLVERLADEIAAATTSPYVLGGHSMGALLAFEVARRLRHLGLPPPRALIATGARAPHCPRTEPDLHALPDDVFVHEVNARYGGIPAVMLENRDFLELFVPALRADLEVFETYVHQPGVPLNCPLLALGGTADARVSRDQTLAWREHTTGAFESAFFPGDHFFTQSHAAAVTARLGDFLQRQVRDVTG